MSAAENLERIIASPEFAPYIAVNRLLPAESGSFAPFPGSLNPRIANALLKRGYGQLYILQA
jgi:hypothetical protein